jgi:hypothetical protein
MGCGKSHLLHNCPHAAIFNFDRSQISGLDDASHRAQVWPWINKDGQTCDSDGKPFQLTWEAARAKFDELIQKAKAGNPNRPKTVVIDSVRMATELCTNQFLQSLPLDKRTVQAKWNIAANVYFQVTSLIDLLVQAGYGTVVVVHVGEDETEWTDTSKEEGDPSRKYKVRRLVPKVPPSIQESVFRSANLIVRMDKRTVTEVETKTIHIPIPGTNNTVPKQQTTTTEKQKFFLLTVDKEMPSTVKSRIAGTLPREIEIPERDPWDALERAYTTATSGTTP